MKVTTSLTTLSLLAGADAADTVLGAFVFHRHGDRTPKALAPTNLTALGYEQVYTSGQYYRSRYLSGASKIRSINSDTVKLSQLAVTAPVDNVLQNSAQGFLQGLYPPVQTVQVLANGQSVSAPMDGYQLIPVNTIETGAGSEDAGWLQDASSCPNAKSSSNSFFESKEYMDLQASTKELYQSVVPAVNGVIAADQINFKNGYIVYDILNVASIHNSSLPSTFPSNSTLASLRYLADTHEWGLAYNSSDTIRAVSGMQLAGEILSSFHQTISSQGSKPALSVQFGAYATFMSFFGLADLPAVNGDFRGVVGYASSLVFELFTSTDVSSGFPKDEDLKVRFLFHNGTATNTSEPVAYPLFGSNTNELSWKDFQAGLAKFAITSTQQWCEKCGDKTGKCAAYAPKTDATTQSAGGKGGMSPAIGGVIGAFVTLAVVLGTMAAVMLIGGFTLAKKRKNGERGVGGENVETKA